MRRMLTFGVLAGLAGVLLAAPIPKDNRNPAAFPAGRYVLAGAGEAATGDDVLEIVKTFRLRPGQYILSGGQKPTDALFVDDDLDLFQGETKLFVDDDHVRTTEDRGKFAARYQGQPIVLVLDPTKKLRVRATDCCASEAMLGELWLHRWDGARKKLTNGKVEASAANLPAVFFDESFALTDGFELPDKVATDAATDMPEKPA